MILLPLPVYSGDHDLNLSDIPGFLPAMVASPTFRRVDVNSGTCPPAHFLRLISTTVPLVRRLEPEDRFDLVVVAMQRNSRIAVCPTLARNRHVKSFLFLGNDLDGFHRYLDLLPKHKVLLGFPGAGGGWRDNELVVMDQERAGGPTGEVYLGELDGVKRHRTLHPLHPLAGGEGRHRQPSADCPEWREYFRGAVANGPFMLVGSNQQRAL